MASKIFVFILAVIAGIVAHGLYRKRVMWKWIVVYWCVLTVKNLIDFVG